ncbi:MAG: SH3 domain-containing protein [Saccharofermentanales bacterium]
MVKKNFAQKTLILLVLFALVFGSVFTEQVKAEPLDGNSVESAESEIAETDLSEEDKSVLETSETIANDSIQKSDDVEPNESEVETIVSATEPTEEVTEPTEEVTEPAEEVTEPAEEATEPTEEATEPAEEATEPAEEAESTSPIIDNTADADLPMNNNQRQVEADYRYWGNGTNNGFNNGTSYSGWCYAVAYTKILIQSGAYSAPSFTPPVLHQTMLARYGRGVSNNGYCNFTRPEVVAISNGKLISTADVDIGGSLANKKATIMHYVNNGYQVIVQKSGHVAAIDNISSLNHGTPYVMNSINTSNYSYRMQNSVVPMDHWSAGFENAFKIFVFKKAGGTSTPSTLESWGGTASFSNVTSTSAQIRFDYGGRYNISHYGFFIGENPNSLTKVPEDIYAANVPYIFYDLGTGKWTSALKPGTTYYYKFYSTLNGQYLESNVYNFTTKSVAPTSATLTVSKSSATVGETLTFRASGNNNPTKFTIGIDKGSQRVLTQSMPNGVLSINTLPAGQYSAYVTASNSAGSVDSARINFSVVNPKPTVTTGYIYANSRIRTAPNGSVITRLWRPILVSGFFEGSWFRFTYNGRTAYVAANLVTNRNAAMTGYAKQKLYVRNTPNGSIIGTITIGRQVSGVLVGDRVRITYNGQTGYIYASLLQANPVRISRYVMAGSNIRTSPNGSIVYKSRLPFYVTGTIRGSWLHYKVGNADRYVFLSNLTSSSPSITGYASGELNVRSSPNGSLIGSYPIGRQISGTLIREWVRVNYNGQTGYVYAKNLQAVPVKLKCYVLANSVIRNSPNGSIISRPWRPYLVTGTIQGAWLRYTNNGRSSYVAMSSTTTTNPPMTGYAKQTLYVRYTPNGSVVATLPAGYRVSGVLVGNMVRFTYNGRTSYVYASLLRK